MLTCRTKEFRYYLDLAKSIGKKLFGRKKEPLPVAADAEQMQEEAAAAGDPETDGQTAKEPADADDEEKS